MKDYGDFPVRYVSLPEAIQNLLDYIAMACFHSKL